MDLDGEWIDTRIMWAFFYFACYASRMQEAPHAELHELLRCDPLLR